MTRDEAARLLGVPGDASCHVIKRAWRDAARRTHPDLGGDPATFVAIGEARDVLIDRAVVVGEHESGWPDRSDLPVGSVWIEFDDHRGLVWSAITVGPGGTAVAQLLTIRDSPRWATMVVEPVNGIEANGTWLDGRSTDSFEMSIDRVSKLLGTDAFLLVSPFPKQTATVGMWGSALLAERLEQAAVRPDLVTAHAIADTLGEFDEGSDADLVERIAQAATFVSIVLGKLSA